jgi:succinate dehydrogenase hydrophobic anchor subunit
MATSVIHVFVLLFYLATESKHATENCHNPAMDLTVIIIIIIIFLHMENAWRAARLRLATATSSISF